jgi:hypothetical protein
MAAWFAEQHAQRTTCRTQRQWRISVDDSTIAFGTAACSRALPVLSARAVSVSAVRVSGWSAQRCTLRDPAAVLTSDLLARVCASLSVRELLQCAAVNRAWRRVISPVPPALPSACIWELVDLSGFAIDTAAKLTNHVLPRWGSSIRELSLSSTQVDDDGLRAVVAGCPLLRDLDVSDCPRVFRLSCEHPNVNAFTELMLQLYARAKPLEHFTLYMQCCGFTSHCSDCGEYCNAYIQLASNSLDMVRRWTVKAESGQDAPEIPTAWLQCDLLTLCKNLNFQHSQSCEVFIEEFEAPLLASGLIDFEGLDCICGFCKTPTCQVRSAPLRMR